MTELEKVLGMEEISGLPNTVEGWLEVLRGKDPDHVYAIAKHITNQEAQQAVKEFERKRAGIEMPTAYNLEDLFNHAEDEIDWLVEGLASKGHKVLFVAAEKVGKSTAVSHLAYCLLNGEPFMGQFKTQKVPTVALIDLELGLRTLGRTASKAGVKPTDNFKVFGLRGNAGAFAIDSEEVREYWVEQLRDIDVVIIDPLGPALDYMGIDENSSAVGAALSWIDEIMYRANVGSYIVVQHAGHGSGNRARGHSKFMGWSDASWIYTRGEDKQNVADVDIPRFFMAKGRDEVSLAPGQVTYEEGNLSFSSEAPGSQTNGMMGDLLNHYASKLNPRQERTLAYLANGDRMSTKEIAERLKIHDIAVGGNGVLNKDLDALVTMGKINSEKQGVTKYFWIDQSPSPLTPNTAGFADPDTPGGSTNDVV